MNDLELLGEYVQKGSEAAFAELVRRHIDWVRFLPTPPPEGGPKRRDTRLKTGCGGRARRVGAFECTALASAVRLGSPQARRRRTRGGSGGVQGQDAIAGE